MSKEYDASFFTEQEAKNALLYWYFTLRQQVGPFNITHVHGPVRNLDNKGEHQTVRYDFNVNPPRGTFTVIGPSDNGVFVIDCDDIVPGQGSLFDFTDPDSNC